MARACRRTRLARCGCRRSTFRYCCCTATRTRWAPLPVATRAARGPPELEARRPARCRPRQQCRSAGSGSLPSSGGSCMSARHPGPSIRGVTDGPGRVPQLGQTAAHDPSSSLTLPRDVRKIAGSTRRAAVGGARRAARRAQMRPRATPARHRPLTSRWCVDARPAGSVQLAHAVGPAAPAAISTVTTPRDRPSSRRPSRAPGA